VIQELEQTGNEYTYPEIVSALLAVLNSRVFGQAGIKEPERLIASRKELLGEGKHEVKKLDRKLNR
jgi:hypothetical protein